MPQGWRAIADHRERRRARREIGRDESVSDVGDASAVELANGIRIRISVPEPLLFERIADKEDGVSAIAQSDQHAI